jgi:hypothetical protein
MNINPEIASAKANLVKAASEIDLLEPLRKHPLMTVAIAGAGGVLMGTSELKLGHLASITQSLTRWFGIAMAAAERATANEEHPSGEQHTPPHTQPLTNPS